LNNINGVSAMNIKGKTVLITGASAGIGAACAEVFGEAGVRLLLIARRDKQLASVSESVFKRFGAEIYNMNFDIRKHDEVEQFLGNLPERWKEIDILINNAGLARGMEKIQDGDNNNWDEMIDTNIKGLLYVSRAILPKMIERGTGHVFNIGSLAGHEVYPAGNIYCATKHAVKALTKGMIIDLIGTGVRATNIDPGLVETEFSEVRFRGDKVRAKKIYEGYKPLTGRDIAEIILFAATRPEHVLIQDLLVTPTAQASALIIDKKQ